MILITGGAGYIGSHIARILENHHTPYIVVDNLSTGFAGSVPKKVLHVGDIGDVEWISALMKRYNVTDVLHLAAKTSVPESVDNPIHYYEENVSKSIALIKAAINCHIQRFIFSSSAAVYGTPTFQPVVESTPLHPINPYGYTKKTVEEVLQALSHSNRHMRWLALRYFNVAGAAASGDIGQHSFEAKHLIKMVCKAALKKVSTLQVYGNDYDTPDGTCVRDFIHVEDLAELHLISLNFLKQNPGGFALNCGYGTGFSVLEVIRTFEQTFNMPLPWEYTHRREGDPAILVADTKLLNHILDWKPQFNDLSLILKTAFAFEKRDKPTAFDI